MAIRLRTKQRTSRHYNENQYLAFFLSFFIVATTFLGTTLQGANKVTLKYFSSASEISAYPLQGNLVAAPRLGHHPRKVVGGHCEGRERKSV